MKPINVLHAMLRIPYQLAFAKLKFIVKILWNIDLWPRHSYLTEAFVPGRSDLDLSAYISDPATIKKFNFLYSFFKKFFPFLGEVAIYTPDIIAYLKKHDLNGFELERDPLLLKKFNIILTERNFTSQKAAGYLLMALINDFHKLISNHNSRKKKWIYHARHVQKHIPNFAPLEHKINQGEDSIIFLIITSIVNLYQSPDPKTAEDLRVKMRMYFEWFLNKKIEDYESWLFPVLSEPEWELYTFFAEFVCHIKVRLPQLTEKQLIMFTDQIDWFLFRALRQSYRKKLLESDIKRLEYLKEIVDKFLINNKLKQLISLKEKIEFCEQTLKARLN